MKIETGVMVIKNGRGWGKTYEDGRSTSYWWMSLEDAPIHDPKLCKKPTDVTYKGSHYIEELSSAKVVHVTRTTTVEIKIEGKA